MSRTLLLTLFVFGVMASSIFAAATQFGPDIPLGKADQEWVENTLSQLSIREMTGQLIIEWIGGSHMPTESDDFDAALELVEGGVGGLWMMGGLPHERAAKLNALQEHAKVPLLVYSGEGLGKRMFSFFGGVVWMLGGGTDMPPAMAYGAIGDPAAAREAGRIIGLEARATGLHMRGDPCLAVLTDLDDALHNRTFGDDPEQIGRLAAAFIQGAHEAGLLVTPGFFPGAGALTSDPHVELPIERGDRAHFDTLYFVPFKHVIKAGTDLIMSSHIGTPGLTGSDSLPATLSPEITRILREDLGFNGLLITDAFAMGGLTNNYGFIEATILAFEAGNDFLLGTDPLKAADTLAVLVESGKYPVERLRKSVRRILEAKARLGLHKNATVSLDAVSQVVGRRSHQRAADSAADRSIVLLRDRANLVPLTNPSELRVLSITFETDDNKKAGTDFRKVLHSNVESIKTVRVSPTSDSSIFSDLKEKASSFDLVILSVYLRPQIGVRLEDQVKMSDQFVQFARQLQSEGRRVVLISFGELEVLDRLPDLGTFMLAWSGQPVMQRAAARALLGITPISGRLPLGLPPHHQRGDGLTR